MNNPNHPNMTGYYFYFNKSENIEKIVKFAIECIKLNNGVFISRKETLIMPSKINLSEPWADFHRIVEVIFRYDTISKEKMEKINQIWNNINESN